MEKINKVDPINWLRVLAALMVFFLHCTLKEATDFFGDNWTFIMRTPAWGGVWIFFVLSGYLFGSAYAKKRYVIDVKSVFEFYKKRLLKTIIPTFVFIFLCCVLAFPDFLYNNPIAIIRFLNFSYRGDPGASGIGACWYVFCIAWLWLVTPCVAYIMNSITNSKNAVIYAIFFIALCVGGFYVRNYLLIDADWSTAIYSNAVVNTDLYFGGFVFAYLLENMDEKFLNLGKNRKIVQILSFVLVIAVVLSNCYIYNKMLLPEADPMWRHMYSYVYETVYLVVCCIFFWANYQNIKYMKADIISLRKNPFRIIDLFAEITFEFYLFHSLILNRISPYVPLENGTLSHHFLLVAMTFVITLIFALGFHKLFLDFPKKNCL